MLRARAGTGVLGARAPIAEPPAVPPMPSEPPPALEDMRDLRPALECHALGGGTPKALGSTADAGSKGVAKDETPYLDDPSAPATNTADGLKTRSGGLAFSKDKKRRTYADVDYRDRFDAPGWWTDQSNLAVYRLRALTRYEVEPGGAVGQPLSSLVAHRRPIEVLFTETFEPSGRVWKARGSFAQWRALRTSALASNPAPEATKSGAALGSIGGANGALRPVLSALPGHANGVLLVDGDLTFWAGRSGALQPARGRKAGCWAFGGYVDPRGKLFFRAKTRRASPGSKKRTAAASF